MIERAARRRVRALTIQDAGRHDENVRILLTNDDGITSDGLWAAARGLARVGQLTVIGTTDDWSNGGASIRHVVGSRIGRYGDVPADLPPDVQAYAIEASPGGAVVAGLLTGLFEPFDLVVSGANYGINVGGDLLYSGTFGAALVGFQRGVTSFAISSERGVNRGEEQRWDGIADVAERIAAWLLRRRGSPLLLNVNVPNRSFADTTGARITRPVRWANLDRAKLRAEPDSDGSWRIAADFVGKLPDADDLGTDFGAVFAGAISITPLVPIGQPSEPPPADLDDLVAALAPDGSVASII
jgi:5'-nucleotidase